MVDVFSGASLAFRPSRGSVEVVPIPWHRRWSHSLTLTALLGGVLALLVGPLCGGVYALGSLTHILEDQMGHMGSNLFYPFTRTRTAGCKWFHSGDALPNLLAVWLSAVLLLLNLDRFSPAPVLGGWRLLGFGLVIPWATIAAVLWWRGHWRNACGRATSAVVRATTLVDVEADGERTPVEPYPS